MSNSQKIDLNHFPVPMIGIFGRVFVAKKLFFSVLNPFTVGALGQDLRPQQVDTRQPA